MNRALVVLLLSATLASCGGSDDAKPTQRSTVHPWSPDAGIAEGHAVADVRAQRCRAALPPGWRAWRRCNRDAR